MTIIIVIGSVLVLFILYLTTNKKNSNSDITNSFNSILSNSISFNYAKREAKKMDVKLENVMCINCGTEAPQLKWFKFETSGYRQLAGHKGFYAKCPQCDIKVYEFAPYVS